MINNLMEDPVTAIIGLIVPVAGIICWKIFDIKLKKEEQQAAK